MASLFEVALRDMRKPGQPTPYLSSYAPNEDTWWLRKPPSIQRVQASLVMGRYPNSTAWDAGINPDAGELAWMANPGLTWSRVNWWCHCVYGDTYRNVHAPGYTGNTRVMIFGMQVWVKSKATGKWVKRIDQNATTGEWWSPSFETLLGGQEAFPTGRRVEPSTGYVSVQPPPIATYGYAMWHGWGQLVSIDPWDVADVLTIVKTALVLHDSNGTDDRDASRFMANGGSDYYPDSPAFYPGVGTGRLKFVRAKWPNWQFHVMHTMTEAQLNAPGGFPPELMSLSEGEAGGGETPVEPGGPSGPFAPIVTPSVGAWQPLMVSGVPAWGAQGPAITPAVSGGIPPILRRRR